VSATLSYTLDEGEREVFSRLGAQAIQRDGFAVEQLPDGLRTFLRRIVTSPGDAGFAVLRGVPVGELPPTPDRRMAGLLSDHTTSGCLLLIAETLGSMIGYQDEKSGALLHDVHPVRGEETRIENTGSMNFGFHTENVHHPLRPDFLGLLCLRQDHDRMGTTRLASIRESARELAADTIEQLRMPRFRSLYPTSFTGSDGTDRPSSETHPVVFGEGADLFMRFNVHNTYALDEDGAVALKHLAAALDRNCRQVLLEPGDVAIISNHIAAHGRSAFRPRYDGNDRWLRRFYSLTSIPSWVTMPAPRVLPPVADVCRAQPSVS
jgi:L-asparagine oxygenase